MAVNNKKNRKKQKQSNYRLVVLQEDSYQERFALSLSRRNMFLITFSVVVILVLLTSITIFYTPIREYIPGYDTTKIRVQAVENLEKLDSLMNTLANNKRFIESLSKTLNGENYKNEYESEIIDSDLGLMDLMIETSIEDSILRRFVEKEDKFNVIESPKKEFFSNIISPAKGLISQKFNYVNNHYGIDIALAERTPIKAISDALVLFSGWTLNSGHTVILSHNNQYISIYKHNSSSKVKVGQNIKQGMVIALSGNTGELTSGPHLHFELWDSQGPINPEDLIGF